MEAENAHQNIPRNSQMWQSVTTIGGYSGLSAMQALPDNSQLIDTGYATTSPELAFDVDFTQGGTYYVWVRIYSTNDLDNSLHVGLDGAETPSGNAMEETNYNAWTWSKNRKNSTDDASLNVTAGLHTVNLWMREDEVAIDKVLLTTDVNFTPTGTGPAESPQGQPALSIGDIVVNEGNSGGVNAVFTVIMSAASNQAITVDYATADSTALAGLDYAATSGTLTIPVDSTNGSITVPIIDDALNEPTEVFKLRLSNATGATLSDSLGLGSITDTDPLPTLSIADTTADEAAGTMAFTVTMSGISTQAVTVDYATADSTALAGLDYAVASGTLTIPVDSTSGVITVPITDDVLSEGSELFKLQLSNSAGAILLDSLGLGAIADNDPLPVLTVADTTADEAAGAMAFTVMMSSLSGQAVTVIYATSDSTALAGLDYTATADTLTIPADSISAVIYVPITDDALSEGSEVFKLQLSNAVGATLTDSLALGSITDNEALPTLSIADTTADEAAGTMAFYRHHVRHQRTSRHHRLCNGR